MRFSVIIPIYNSENHLRKTLDSVCSQKYSDFEVVCINDGSTDNSLDILEHYQQQFPFVKIVNQENAGPSAARNKGLELAMGEYVMFCDSDDWYERNTILSELDAYINQQEQIVDVVYFPGNTNWGGNTECASGFAEKKYLEGWELLSDHCLQSQGTLLFFGSLYAFVYRLDVIRTHAISYNTSVSYSEDRLFVFDFLDKAEISIVYPKSCYFYNVHSDSLMTNKYLNERKIRDEFKVAEIMIKRKWSHNPTYEVKKYISSFYLSSIKNMLTMNECPKIRYVWALLPTITSVRRLIACIILFISPMLYRKVMKYENSIANCFNSCF